MLLSNNNHPVSNRVLLAIAGCSVNPLNPHRSECLRASRDKATPARERQRKAKKGIDVAAIVTQSDPVKQVNVCKITHNGNIRFRVMVPKDLVATHGCPFKRFALESEAEEFAKMINGSRQTWFSRLSTLTDDDQGRIVRALELAGSASEIEAAVGAWLAVRAKTRRNLVDAVKEYVGEMEKRGNTKRHTDHTRATMARFVATREALNVADVSAADITTWLSNQPWGPKTRNNCWVTINSFFIWATGRKFCADNPMATVAKFKEKDAAVTVLSIADIRKVMTAANAAGPEATAYFALAIFAGIRPAEVQRLTLASFKTSGGRAFVDVGTDISKTASRRLVNVSPVLASWLALAPNTVPSISRWVWDSVVEASGVEWAQDCARHSFVSYSLPVLGVVETAKQAGHSEAVLMKHYRLVVTDEQAAEFATLTAQAVLAPVTSNIVSMAAAA